MIFVPAHSWKFKRGCSPDVRSRRGDTPRVCASGRRGAQEMRGLGTEGLRTIGGESSIHCTNFRRVPVAEERPR